VKLDFSGKIRLGHRYMILPAGCNKTVMLGS
jgi:hypothetical protein